MGFPVDLPQNRFVGPGNPHYDFSSMDQEEWWNHLEPHKRGRTVCFTIPDAPSEARGSELGRQVFWKGV